MAVLQATGRGSDIPSRQVRISIASRSTASSRGSGSMAMVASRPTIRPRSRRPQAAATMDLTQAPISRSARTVPFLSHNWLGRISSQAGGSPSAARPAGARTPASQSSSTRSSTSKRRRSLPAAAGYSETIPAQDASIGTRSSTSACASRVPSSPIGSAPARRMSPTCSVTRRRSAAGSSPAHGAGPDPPACAVGASSTCRRTSSSRPYLERPASSKASSSSPGSSSSRKTTSSRDRKKLLTGLLTKLDSEPIVSGTAGSGLKAIDDDVPATVAPLSCAARHSLA